MANEPELIKQYKCQCGADEPLFAKQVKAAKNRGEVPEAEKLAYKTIQIPVASQKIKPKAGDQVTIVMLAWDICEKCGREYLYTYKREILPIVFRNEPVEKRIYVPGNGGGMPAPRDLMPPPLKG